MLIEVSGVSATMMAASTPHTMGTVGGRKITSLITGEALCYKQDMLYNKHKIHYKIVVIYLVISGDVLAQLYGDRLQ